MFEDNKNDLTSKEQYELDRQRFIAEMNGTVSNVSVIGVSAPPQLTRTDEPNAIKQSLSDNKEDLTSEQKRELERQQFLEEMHNIQTQHQYLQQQRMR